MCLTRNRNCLLFASTSVLLYHHFLSGPCCSFFMFLCCVVILSCYVCLRPVFFGAQCCRCVWTIHSWLLLRFSSICLLYRLQEFPVRVKMGGLPDSPLPFKVVDRDTKTLYLQHQIRFVICLEALISVNIYNTTNKIHWSR